MESLLMIFNNLIFFSIWWIFFRQFNDVSGWQLDDLILMMIVGIAAYGLMVICFGGVKILSRIILNGDLDTFMIQPKNLLFHVIGSKSISKGWGNLGTAIVLLFLGGITEPYKLALIFICTISGCLVFTSMNVIAGSLPFWMGSIESVTKRYCESLFLFALYPSNIYSGILQVAMFTVIPAGVIGYLPVELIRNFSWGWLFMLLGSSFVFVGAAFFVFYSGLKRYESGNKFGTRL